MKRLKEWRTGGKRAGFDARLPLGYWPAAQAVNRRFRPPDELGVGLAQPLTTPARPIDAKPRPSGNWQGAAKLAARYRRAAQTGCGLKPCQSPPERRVSTGNLC